MVPMIGPALKALLVALGILQPDFIPFVLDEDGYIVLNLARNEDDVATALDFQRFEMHANVSDQMIQLSYRVEIAMTPLIEMNDSGRLKEFKAEMDWRQSAWGKLNEALHPLSRFCFTDCESGLDMDKLEQIVRKKDRDVLQGHLMEELRLIIGDEAFFAGRMPNPTANIKVPYKN